MDNSTINKCNKGYHMFSKGKLFMMSCKVQGESML